MGTRTRTSRLIVLQKRARIGEKDLVIVALDESGCLVSAVAKGALKPGGSLAAKLEPLSLLSARLAQGRSLDIVTEGSLVGGFAGSSFSLEQGVCAAPIVELVSMVAQEGLEHGRLFDLVEAALRTTLSSDGDSLLCVTASGLVKVFSMCGFRPSLTACVSCGRDIALSETRSVALSILEGGLVCDGCSRPADSSVYDANLVRWINALLLSTFDDALHYGLDAETAFSILQFERQWIQAHVGRRLKSLDFLFSSGLFG